MYRRGSGSIWKAVGRCTARAWPQACEYFLWLGVLQQRPCEFLGGSACVAGCFWAGADSVLLMPTVLWVWTVECEAGSGVFGVPVLIRQLRGVKVLGGEVKQGNVIERKGHIFQVLKTQHTQQGRGGATIQVELRDVQSGLKSTERLRTSEAIERVFVDEKNFTFLYLDGDSAILMEPTTFEQLEVPKIMFGNGAAYLSDGLSVTVQFFDGKPLSAAVPSRVTCTVVEAEPSFKGQTATPVYKKALLQNGRHAMVPPFINTGNQIVIDTADDTYVTRAKD